MSPSSTAHRSSTSLPSPSQSESVGHPGADMKTTKSSTPVLHLPTSVAYDAWAAVYDTDGNMLQAVDDSELEELLPAFLGQVKEKALSDQNRSLSNDARDTPSPPAVQLVDLGCGTGRNTAKLAKYGWGAGVGARILGIDASKGMLDRARDKLAVLEGVRITSTTEVASSRRGDAGVNVELVQHDFLLSPSASGPLTSWTRGADALISTLVLEHLPLDVFFASVAGLLKPGGVALVTNMHPDMGKVSQAGFVADAAAISGAGLLPDGQAGETGEGKKVKVRGTSWAHEIDETVAVAQAAGLELVGTAREKEVTEDMVGSVVGERGGKWIGYKVWFSLVLKKRE